ncbi:MAG: hypothetical protein KOO63_10970 [Bacteroidales bacterium]|nr:hypothetical protein [Candidatus Latescibacterota bacterium]
MSNDRLKIFKAFSGSILLVLVVMMLSCSDGDLSGKVADYEIDRTFTRGPVDFRVAVSRKEVTIADRLDLLVEARAREGYVAELPGFGDKLDQFGIVDYTSPPPRLEEGGVVVTSRVYELEPFLSGEYKILPMMVTFREEGDSISTYSVESDTLKVTVLSILPEDMAELEMKDIAGPAAIPASRRWLYITAGAMALAAATVLLYLRFRKKRTVTDRIILAHEKAFALLERLLSEGLVEEKRYSEFTERVSDILRHYIEDRFGLRAPERTTEEFLTEAGSGLDVEDEQKRMLRDFLAHCDLVKFAAFEPSEDDVKKTFGTCRDFIDMTKKEEEVNGGAEQAAEVA